MTEYKYNKGFEVLRSFEEDIPGVIETKPEKGLISNALEEKLGIYIFLRRIIIREQIGLINERSELIFEVDGSSGRITHLFNKNYNQIREASAHSINYQMMRKDGY